MESPGDCKVLSNAITENKTIFPLVSGWHTLASLFSCFSSDYYPYPELQHAVTVPKS